MAHPTHDDVEEFITRLQLTSYKFHTHSWVSDADFILGQADGDLDLTLAALAFYYADEWKSAYAVRSDDGQNQQALRAFLVGRARLRDKSK